MPPRKTWAGLANGNNMLSPGEIAIIKAEIKRLEEARKDCADGGIRKQIEVWIAEQKKILASENDPK
jgi:hypothetical protein